jgi:ATP-dependent RNA helicase RhlE
MERIERRVRNPFTKGGSTGGYRGNRTGGSTSRFGGGHSRYGGTSGSGNRGGFSRGGGYRSQPARGRKGMGQYIDPAKFVKKASPVLKIEETKVVHNFTDFKLDKMLEGNIVHKGYTTPTPIQDKAIPHILLGRDVVGIANTGTGKTGAFVIPLIEKILKNRKEKVIILAPTRELAIQIDDELRTFAKGLRIYSAICVGGSSMFHQITDLRRNPSFVIGTPGRIKDHVERGYIKLPEYNTVVLDEADRMLDMGFIHDMRALMSKLPKDRHTLFFSATLSREIEALIGEFLRNPERISVKTQDTSENVDQDVIRVQGANKLDVLHDLLKKEDMQKVLIFGRTKHGVEKLSKILKASGHTAESIHGNKTNSHRQKALSAFKNNTAKILVATDVAARGLDIPNVSHVINFDIPATYDDYVHRIGRTGRGNSTGKALTFIE